MKHVTVGIVIVFWKFWHQMEMEAYCHPSPLHSLFQMGRKLGRTEICAGDDGGKKRVCLCRESISYSVSSVLWRRMSVKWK
jgi:hypothetical protein